MNNATLQAFRKINEAMNSSNNFAVEIEVGGQWQLVIDKLTESDARQLASRWDRSRVVKTF